MYSFNSCIKNELIQYFFFKLIIINCIAIDIIFAEVKLLSSKWNKCRIYVGDQLDRCRWMEQTQGSAMRQISR
jgi:DNA-directed RNA polymerase alpha subunit